MFSVQPVPGTGDVRRIQADPVEREFLRKKLLKQVAKISQ